MRQQIQSDLAISPELARLLAEASSPSESELREQRVSFAYGNAMNIPGITKESIRETARRIYGD
jgi:hypothetical protein